MENTDNQNNRVPLSAKIDNSLFEVVEGLARIENRSISNMVETLLKASPQVQEQLANKAPAIAA